jgi:hypothetical protein
MKTFWKSSVEGVIVKYDAAGGPPVWDEKDVFFRSHPRLFDRMVVIIRAKKTRRDLTV